MSARQALLRMQADGLITLPAPRRRGGGSTTQRGVTWTAASDPQPSINGFRGDLRDLCLVTTTDRHDFALWRELIARHHDLGYTPLTGALGTLYRSPLFCRDLLSRSQLDLRRGHPGPQEAQPPQGTCPPGENHFSLSLGPAIS